MELIFIDTETTGIDVATDRLVQVCYRDANGIHTEYFKPPIPMTVKSMSITHITDAMLVDKPTFADSQMKKDLTFLLSSGIFVAHNAKFDMAILEKEGVKTGQYICTLRVAKNLDKEGEIPEYNLQYLRYHFGLNVEGNPHDAEGDVNVLVALFNKQLEEVMKTIPNREEAIKKMIEISSTPSLYKIFNFGKHKEEKIADVAVSDRGYLEWLLNQKLISGEEDEDWIYTLKYYLGK